MAPATLERLVADIRETITDYQNRIDALVDQCETQTKIIIEKDETIKRLNSKIEALGASGIPHTVSIPVEETRLPRIGDVFRTLPPDDTKQRLGALEKRVAALEAIPRPYNPNTRDMYDARG
jgi:flagellar motility protein MotE (MotC chaperone)